MSALTQILKAIKKLSAAPESTDLAVSRAERLNELTDLGRYAPNTIARSTLTKTQPVPGFSQDLSSTRDPVGATLTRPSEFLSRTPEFESRDAPIIDDLVARIRKEKLKRLPLYWAEEYRTPTVEDYLTAQQDGRHRMAAMQRLYGDDPVLANLYLGNRYSLGPSRYSKGLIDQEYLEPLSGSPLELFRRQFHSIKDNPMNPGMGSPYRIDPLWIKE